MASPRYLLDTNICIFIAKHQPPSVRQRFELLSADQLAMSAITWGELAFGIAKSATPQRAEASLAQLRSVLRVEPMGISVGEHYGRIRQQLHAQGTPIGSNDLWIAAHAMALDAVLVTHNVREFQRVEGLRWENWVD
jgi:tRNA(fMet)-specific endonuclease VapC